MQEFLGKLFPGSFRCHEMGGLEKDYGERDAERMIQKCGEKLDLPTEAEELRLLRKGDERKALMATLIRLRTAASTEWIATRLQMGIPGSVSRQVGIVKKNLKLLKKLNELEKMCHCGQTDPRDSAPPHLFCFPRRHRDIV